MLWVGVSSHFSTYTVLEKSKNLHPKQLFVRIYHANNLGRVQGRATCVAVSKCVRLMRDRVWRVTGRVMVLCVSKEDEVIFSKVIPGSSNWVKHLRYQLTTKLMSEPRVRPLFDGEDTLSGVALAPGSNLFFVISFTREVHSRAVNEMLLCCNNMGVEVQEYGTDITVNVKQ